MVVSTGLKRVTLAVCLAASMAACFIAGRHLSSTPQTPIADSSKHVLYYVDPMHPGYKSDKPGIAPDCGMALVAVYASTSSSATPANAVYIGTDRQQLAGIRGEAASLTNSATQLRVTGKVLIDDTRLYRVHAGASGWIRQTFDSSIGSHVKKDQRLATFYSPDFQALEQGYLVATERIQAGVKMKDPPPGTQTTSVRLKNLGMSETQIEELGRTRQMPDQIDIVAPAEGFIVSRNLADGQKFEMGTEFYRIADLSHVWIEANIVQDEAQDFKPGTVATIQLPGQSRKLQARVSDTLPQFDPASRTMKLRLEADNPGYLLRPDMLVDVDLSVHPHSGLSVPVDAVIDQGTQQKVFLDLGNGYFEPRSVQTGWRSGGRVEIKQGLNPGELVVVDGTFLLDSETRLKQGTASSDAPPSHPAMAQMQSMKPAVHSLVGSKTVAMGMSETTDPECGMPVQPSKSLAAGNTLSANGKTLYFCSKSCKDKFTKKQSATAMAMSSSGGQS